VIKPKIYRQGMVDIDGQKLCGEFIQTQTEKMRAWQKCAMPGSGFMIVLHIVGELIRTV